MSNERRPLRRFPNEWFATEEYIAPGGGEPREAGFSRLAHSTNLLAGIRQAMLSKPEKPVIADTHVFFAARTWKNRPSLRKNLDNVHAKIHRVLPDGAVVASWPSRKVYDDTKQYVAQYGTRQSITSDLDYIESIKGLDHKDKLGRSLLAILEEGDTDSKGLLEIVFYPEYTGQFIHQVVEKIREAFGRRGLVFQKLIPGVGRFTSIWKGPLFLSGEIAARTEPVALIEQAGDLRPASGGAKGKGAPSKLVVATRPQVPEIGILDTGVHAAHSFLSGLVLTGDPALDHIDAATEGGHGTFVAGIVCFGDNPEAQISNGRIEARAKVHPKKVQLAGVPGGINLDSYHELATAVEALRKHTRVFTASLSTTVPIDSDSISPLALNIDLIARKYGVVFVLPTGNLPNYRNGSLASDQPNFLDPSSWLSDPNAQMGRPGESFNGLTVASFVRSKVGEEYGNVGEATIYSRRGPGPKAMPKPDIAESGGNCRLLIDPSDPSRVELDSDPHPDGSLTNLQAPSGTMQSFGTSFAVPKVAFALAKLVKAFEGLGQPATAPLLAKAYLIHICTYPDTPGPFPDSWTEAERQEKLHLLYGHGAPNSDALDGVLPSELCFYSSGEIARRQRHIYGLKFPTNIISQLPDLRLRVTLVYFTKVDPTALDAELYSLVELTPIVRWGGKTLAKLSRGAPLTDFYPVKSFDVKFSRPRDGEPTDRGQPTVEVVMRDRVTDEDDFKQQYAIMISLVSARGDLLINDMVKEVEVGE